MVLISCPANDFDPINIYFGVEQNIGGREQNGSRKMVVRRWQLSFPKYARVVIKLSDQVKDEKHFQVLKLSLNI